MAFAATVVACVALGMLSHKVLLMWCAITSMIFFLNSLRTLAAHAYRNPADHKMTVAGQYLDSINVPGNLFITALWAPVGLRYHATHHLFTQMPYHNLGKAHRILVNNLSDNAPYLEAVRNSLWDALRRIWNEAQQNKLPGPQEHDAPRSPTPATTPSPYYTSTAASSMGCLRRCQLNSQMHSRPSRSTQCRSPFTRHRSTMLPSPKYRPRCANAWLARLCRTRTPGVA